VEHSHGLVQGDAPSHDFRQAPCAVGEFGAARLVHVDLGRLLPESSARKMPPDVGMLSSTRSMHALNNRVPPWISMNFQGSSVEGRAAWAEPAPDAVVVASIDVEVDRAPETSTLIRSVM
jgi:hypothetical protein